MTENMLWPESAIHIGPKSYRLLGRFEVLAALQQGFNQDIFDIQPRIIGMRQDEIAKFITITARASGASIEDGEIGQALLDEMDISGRDYLLLKGDLMMWITLSTTPKAGRQKKKEELVALRTSLSSSPGPSTEEPAVS